MLKAAIATEILFNLKREPMGPSISGQIAETMAHVLGDNVAIKLLIEKEMKRLYGLWSDIAHRGAVTFDEDDIRLLMTFASDAIVSLLTQAPYKDFTSDEEFVEHLNIIKYSARARRGPRLRSLRVSGRIRLGLPSRWQPAGEPLSGVSERAPRQRPLEARAAALLPIGY